MRYVVGVIFMLAGILGLSRSVSWSNDYDLRMPEFIIGALLLLTGWYFVR